MGEDRSLHIDLIWFPAGIAEREVDEQEAGHAAMFDDVARSPDDDRRDTVRFEMTGNQTHGLVADGSDRRQDRQIDIFITAAAQHLRRIDLARLTLAVGVVDAV